MLQNYSGEFDMQRIVEDSLLLPSLEDLEEVGHSENVNILLSVMAE